MHHRARAQPGLREHAAPDREALARVDEAAPPREVPDVGVPEGDHLLDERTETREVVLAHGGQLHPESLFTATAGSPRSRSRGTRGSVAAMSVKKTPSTRWSRAICR